MKTSTRNRAIVSARSAGKTLQEIGDEHGLTRERVRQILNHKAAVADTLLKLPGSESLSSQTRGVLIRLGYRTLDQVTVALQKGVLRQGCTFGLGSGRFAEIVEWAKAA